MDNVKKKTLLQIVGFVLVPVAVEMFSHLI
jgi:uncharacterized membrane protein